MNCSKQQRNAILRPAALACGAALLVSSSAPALAEWRQFIPRPVRNEAYVESFSSYEREHSDAGRDTNWSDLFFRERFTLASNGYSYHPRFLQYHVSVSGLATQENYDLSGSGENGWSTGGGVEYDTTLSFLPEHSYNLILFASRYEPAFKEQAASSHDTVAETYGATVRYRRKPYFFNATYVDTSIDSDISWSHVKRLGTNAQYFKLFNNGNELSLNVAANPSWTTASEGLDGDAQEYLLSNFLGLGRVSLDSSLSQNNFNQDREPGDKYDTDQRNWYERLSIRWPWAFRTELTYRLYDNQTDVDYVGTSSDRNYDEDGQSIEFDLSHSLYKSLDTRYTLLHDERDSSGGKVTYLSHFASVNYAKAIPVGTFAAGVSYGHTDTDNKGFADIVDDPYNDILVPGTFTLRQQNVDTGSIVVFLRSPLPPVGEVIRLIENVNYRVVPLGNTVEIQMLTLPPEFVVPGTYDFFVTYSLETGTYELESDSFGSTVTFNLFRDLLTPYFSYYGLRTKEVSGNFPGTPVDSDTYTTGVAMREGPWRARGEYQNVDWQVNPWWSWRSEVQYTGNLTPSLTLFSSLWYLKRSYDGGDDDVYGGEAYEDDTLTGSASLQKQIFLRRLYVSVGGSYSNVWGPVDTQAWTANSSLVWKIGKLEITLGLTSYGAENSGSSIYETKRDHELIYLNLKRNLL